MRGTGLSLGVLCQHAFQRFADEALIRDAARLGLGFQGRDQGFGQAHGDPRGFRQGFKAHGFELAEIEGREVLVEEILGGLISGQDGDGFRGRISHSRRPLLRACIGR